VMPVRHQGRAADAAEQGEDDKAAHQLGASLPRPISQRSPSKPCTGPCRVKDAVEQGRVRRARSGCGSKTGITVPSQTLQAAKVRRAKEAALLS
jgi:hypothetical protein